MKPEKIKEDFPIFAERTSLTYLDNAATSQKPEKVINSVSNFYSKNNSNTGRGLYNLANDATQAYEDDLEEDSLGHWYRTPASPDRPGSR